MDSVKRIHLVCRTRLWLTVSVSAVAAAFFSGCSTTPEDVLADDSIIYEVTVSSTPFYRLGPLQEGGPDLQLIQGRRVKYLGRFGGYSRVELENGWKGYVGSRDIGPAPEPEEQAPPEGEWEDLMGEEAPQPGGEESPPEDGLRDAPSAGSSAVVERYIVGDDDEAAPQPDRE